LIYKIGAIDYNACIGRPVIQNEIKQQETGMKNKFKKLNLSPAEQAALSELIGELKKSGRRRNAGFLVPR